MSPEFKISPVENMPNIFKVTYQGLGTPEYLLLQGSIEDCIQYCDDNEGIVEASDGRPLSRSMLKYHFARVEDGVNWKNPINKLLVAVKPEEREYISLAIEFFTGSKAFWSQEDMAWRVKAAGYYLTCGA